MAKRVSSQIDRPLLAVVLLIALLGLYNLVSAGQPVSADLHRRHGVMLLVGLGLMVLVASVHYRNLEGLALPILGLTVALLLATSTFGKLVNGSRRWLVLGPITIQTSDLAKLAVIIVVARTFHLERWDGSLRLREIFRPGNVSRPLIAVVAVLVLSLFGDALRPPKLEVRRLDRWRRVASLRPGGPEIVIGRARGEGKVRLPFAGVSGEHAKIQRIDDGHYEVLDLGSTSGTFVNGERIHQAVRLAHKDVVRFGLNQRAQLRFTSSLMSLEPFLPWLAIVSAVWLGLAFFFQYRKGSWSARDVVAPIDVVAVPCALILIQPDLGTTLVVLLIAFSMLLYVGLRPSSLAILCVSGIVTGVVSWFAVLKPYQKQRVLTFLNPTSDLAGAGYHQHQSLIAIGSGGFGGKGHGQGTQTQLSFLPEQQTDFIFSVWAEEQGFLGCALLVALFCALILISLRIAITARDRFGALLAVGVTAMIFWHTVINMLMVLRLAPVVGVPLPLWSNGGSFALTTMIGIGILLNVSMRKSFF